MPDEITVEVHGLPEVVAKLDELGDAFAFRALRRAVRAGGTVFQEALSANAPVQVEDKGGNSLPAGAVKGDMRLRVGGLRAYAGPSKLTARVVRWLEFGHRMVTHKPKRVVGTVPEHPFMRRTFDTTVQAAAEAATDSLRADIRNFKPAAAPKL